MWVYDNAVHPINRDLSIHSSGQSALLLRQGSVYIANDKGEIHAHAGQWVFPREGNRIQRFTPDARVLSLHFQLSWPSGDPLYDWDVALVLESNQFPELERAANRVLHICHKDNSIGKYRIGTVKNLKTDLEHYIHIQCVYDNWLHTYIKSLAKLNIHPQHLKQIDERVIMGMSLLDQHPLSSVFSKKDFARRMGLSLSQIDRLFIKEISATPHQYYEQRKLEQALVLLQTTSHSIKEIAFELGFSSSSHFSSWLNRKIGFSPLHVRREIEATS